MRFQTRVASHLCHAHAQINGGLPSGLSGNRIRSGTDRFSCGGGRGESLVPAALRANPDPASITQLQRCDARIPRARLLQTERMDLKERETVLMLKIPF